MKKTVLYLLLLFIAIGTSCADTSNDTRTGKSFADCVVSFEQNANIEVVTFNIEHFPKENNTIMHTAELLEHLNADVVALQEISNEGALKALANQMSGWEYVFTSAPSSGGMSLGYLIKMTEVELIKEETHVLFEDERYYFPRAPLAVTVKHRKSGIETMLVNLHLKAFGDRQSVGRRRIASNMLKEHLDASHVNDFVIVLGDYNDELAEEKAIDDVFLNFTDDPDAYRFVDMRIAEGNEENWSYPGMPSHIDHILISNEWFEYFDATMTISADRCFANYEEYISDHRPVVVVFYFD
jgi:endonuclease/exonuclease/phosphatase family metal-dependent hydrolase